MRDYLANELQKMFDNLDISSFRAKDQKDLQVECEDIIDSLYIMPTILIYVLYLINEGRKIIQKGRTS